MIIGFQENSTVTQKTGIKKGSTVLIPKGTKVVSTHPSKGTYITKKDIKIKVHHLGYGQNVPVNDSFYQHQIKEYSKQEGSFCIIGTSGDGTLLPRGLDSFVPLHNPEVVYAGTGGYWCRVDINKVIHIQE